MQTSTVQTFPCKARVGRYIRNATIYFKGPWNIWNWATSYYIGYNEDGKGYSLLTNQFANPMTVMTQLGISGKESLELQSENFITNRRMNFQVESGQLWVILKLVYLALPKAHFTLGSDMYLSGNGITAIINHTNHIALWLLYMLVPPIKIHTKNGSNIGMVDTPLVNCWAWRKTT